MSQWTEILAGLSLTSAGAKPGDVAPQLVPLASWAIWRLAGPEAQAFLQGQTTSDIQALTPGAWQHSGYCTPKGRLLASFPIWRSDAETFHLLLPRSLAEAVMSRLTRYVLRAKLKISPAPLLALGLLGPKARHFLAEAALPAPAPGACAGSQGFTVLGLAADRFLLAAQAEAIAQRWPQWAEHTAVADESAWDSANIAAGVATVLPATQELFIPQMLNFDLVGGLSYTKGCYPGQEIVARMHYLGRLKERLFHAAVEAPALPGDKLYSPVFGEQACGTVANAVSAGNADTVLLAVLQTAAAKEAVHLGAPDGPVLRFLPLPYPFPEAPQ